MRHARYLKFESSFWKTPRIFREAWDFDIVLGVNINANSYHLCFLKNFLIIFQSLLIFHLCFCLHAECMCSGCVHACMRTIKSKTASGDFELTFHFVRAFQLTVHPKLLKMVV